MSEAASRHDAPYGLLARFDSDATLLAAIRALRGEGHTTLEAFSPYPIEELSEALGFHSRWLTVASLVGALLAAAAGYVMIWYSAVIDYPFVVGGKPLHSWPPFALIAFVLAILAAVLVAFIGMLTGNRLPRPYHPAFNVALFERASADGLFLLVAHNDDMSNGDPSGGDPSDDLASLRDRLRALGADEIHEVPP